MTRKKTKAQKAKAVQRRPRRPQGSSTKQSWQRGSTRKPRKKAAPPSKRSLWGRLAVFSLSGVLLLTIAGLIGSAYMQVSIAALLRERALASFAVVVSRPFALAKGVRPLDSGIRSRLERLRYAVRESRPERQGQARLSKEFIEIYLRGFVSQQGRTQSSQLVRASLDAEGRIERLVEVESNSELKAAWLEPEPLALLGATERRAVTPTTLSEVSPWIPKALIAIEDERFYQHFGIDPIAIARAAVVNLRSGQLRQGGSTLTQQLAKNLFYGSERTLSRKAKEAVAALLIETAFEKDEILEMYLNEIFLGQEGRVALHGFGEASLAFFGKDVSELSLGEAATLVGMVKAPSYYSLRRHPERATKRRDVVLESMLTQKVISKAEYLKAKDEKLKVQTATRSRRQAPYHVDYIRSVLADAAPIDALSLQPVQIHSGIDVEYQNCAERAVSEGLGRLEKQYPRLAKRTQALQAALVSVVPSTGEFIAWVGGRDYQENQFERVSLAARQTGSAFKPIVYLTALDANLNSYRVARTTSLLVDEPVRLKPVGGSMWEPKNYDGRFRGDVTLREALVRSLNIPAVQLSQKVGIQSIVGAAQLLGVERNLPAVPALALGAAELTPLELTRAYATIANGGKMVPFRPIVAVTKTKPRPEIQFEAPLRDSQRVSEQASFILTDMLITAVDRGTGNSVRRSGYSLPAAGKTGTTNDARDAWFAGYTPRLLTIVWVGFDDNSKTGLTGGQAAAPIWSSYMRCVQSMEPAINFIPPPGIVYKTVDLQSGLLANDYCPDASRVTEIFIEGTEPRAACDRHGGGFLDELRQEAEAVRARIQRDEQPRKPTLIDSILDNLWR